MGSGYLHLPRGKRTEHHQRRLLISIGLRRMWLSVSRPKLSRSFFDLQSSSAIPRPRSSCQYGRPRTKSLPYVIYNRIQTSTTRVYTSTISWQQRTSQPPAPCNAHQLLPPPACRRNDVTLSFRVSHRDKLSARALHNHAEDERCA